MDPAQAFELPADAARSYVLTSPFPQREVAGFSGAVNAATPVRISLQPFEVLVFEAAPVR